MSQDPIPDEDHGYYTPEPAPLPAPVPATSHVMFHQSTRFPGVVWPL